MSRARLAAWLMALAIVVVASLGARPAAAHALDVTTARVTLRDGRVEVALDVDLVQLVSKSVPELEDAMALAASSDETVRKAYAETRRILEAGARVEVSGVAVPLVLRSFPAPPELMLLAAEAAASPHRHPATSVLRLETVRPVLALEAVSVALPPSVGPVLYTFVEPQTRLTGPGSAATFTLRSSVREQPAPQRAPWPTTSWLALAAGILAAIALASHLLPRRRLLIGAAPEGKGERA